MEAIYIHIYTAKCVFIQAGVYLEFNAVLVAVTGFNGDIFFKGSLKASFVVKSSFYSVSILCNLDVYKKLYDFCNCIIQFQTTT